MNPARALVYAFLTGDDDLAVLLADPPADEEASVYHRQAPQRAPGPYLIFNRQSSTEERQMAASVDNQVWLIKAVHRHDSPSEAEAIDELVRTLTEETRIEFGRLVRESGVSYSEPTTPPIWHEGGLYRLRTDRS